MAEWLNYQHLRYFWMVAREGSIAKACKQLHLAQPTISAQIRELEKSLGTKLFEREGRGLVLTDAGRTAYRYADEIFGLGRELRDALQGRPTGRPLRLAVGVADVLPKLIAYRLIEPAMRLEEPVRIVCTDGKPEFLISELAQHKLDLVLSDAPLSPGSKIRAFNHQLGECGISIMGAAAVTRSLRGAFPGSIDGARFLMPSENTALRRSLDHWFDQLGLRPIIVGEFDDSALLKAFGQAGAGLFAAPTVTEPEVCRQYQVEPLGRVEAVRERFYAISVERRLKHPAVVAISQAARREFFA